MTVYDLLRVYRTEKYCPDVAKLIRHMLDIGVDHIIVVVSGPMDKKNTLEEIEEKFPDSERVFAVLSQEYDAPNCWSVALNVGIDIIFQKFGATKGDQLLVLSNEVVLSKNGLVRMRKAIISGVGVVGMKFGGFTAKSYIETPRNTLALWDLCWLIEHEGFPVACDSLGGMEDYANALRMKEEGLRAVILESEGEAKLSIAPVTCQSEKEAKEREAMRKIERIFGG